MTATKQLATELKMARALARGVCHCTSCEAHAWRAATGERGATLESFWQERTVNLAYGGNWQVETRYGDVPYSSYLSAMCAAGPRDRVRFVPRSPP